MLRTIIDKNLQIDLKEKKKKQCPHLPCLAFKCRKSSRAFFFRVNIQSHNCLLGTEHVIEPIIRLLRSYSALYNHSFTLHTPTSVIRKYICYKISLVHWHHFSKTLVLRERKRMQWCPGVVRVSRTRSSRTSEKL